MKPRFLLQAEGLVVLFLACVLYAQWHGSWLWFAILFLVPDLSMLAYLADKRVGAYVYNLAHTYVAPALLLALFHGLERISYDWVVLIWVAHIGWDRLVGYGLKYETAFKDTHLQRV